jgi:hypothetical protein
LFSGSSLNPMMKKKQTQGKAKEELFSKKHYIELYLPLHIPYLIIQFKAAWEVEKAESVVIKSLKIQLSFLSSQFLSFSLSFSLSPSSLPTDRRQNSQLTGESIQFLPCRFFWSAAVIVCLYLPYRYMWLAFELVWSFSR